MKNAFKVLFITFLILMQGICFAGGGLDTSNGSDGTVKGKGKGMTYGSGSTGTRYVLRIDKNDVGGVNKSEYYITHFDDGNKAIIGYGGDNPEEYNNPFNQSTDSSKDTNKKYNSNKGKYRIVTKWFGGDIYTSDFGLSKNNVNTLINMVESHASKIKDKATLAQIKSIKDGDARLEIRAEIVFTSITFHYNQGDMSWGTYKKLGDINIKISGKDMRSFELNFSKGSSKTLPAITYREGMAIRDKIRDEINDQANASYGSFGYIYPDDCLNKSMADVPSRLYEDDAPYVTEEYSTNGTIINEGWDYIRYDATNVILEYKDISTKKDIINSKQVTLLGDKQTYQYKDLSENYYFYTQIINVDKKVNKDVDSCTINNDKKTHTVIFWYEKKEIDVKYRDYNNGTPLVINKKYDYKFLLNQKEGQSVDINDHPKIKNVNNSILKKKYIYMGVQVDSQELSESTVTSAEINTDNKCVVFYYIKKGMNKISIRYREWDNTSEGKLIPDIETKFDTTKQINSSVYITRDGNANDSIINLAYNYKGVTIGQEYNECEDENSIYVSLSDKTVTFWYSKNDITCSIKSIGVFQPSVDDYKTQKLIKNDTHIIPTTKITYEPCSWEGFTYKNEYKIFYNSDEYNGNSENCIKGNQATVSEIKYDSPVEMRKVLIVFYYEKSRDITIYYKDINTKEEIPDMPFEIKHDAGIYSRPEIKDYTFIGVELKKPNEIPMKKDISVEVANDYQNYEIIFWYIKNDDLPKLIYGVPDPNPVPVKNYDELKTKIREADSNKVEENGLLYPNNMNTQYIYQKTNTWVLDEKGKMTIRFATSKATNPKFDLELVFPFNIVYKGKETRTISLENIQVSTYKLPNEDNYFGYQAEVFDIHIPINTTERDYNKEIIGKIKFKCDELINNMFIEGTEKASITIVGAIYDFKVTNINGSNITGDEKWKDFMFSNNEEYGTGSMPIGQGSYMKLNRKYKYGIKLGTRFYFSMNTKGQKNNEIEIIPKYYYYDKSGKYIGEVLLNGISEKESNTIRKTSTRDTNRLLDEFKAELLKGQGSIYKGTYSNGFVSIGNTKLIKIPTGLRMPFIKYGIDAEKYDELSIINDNTLKYVSHWYGDYVLPNNSTFCMANDKSKNVKDGYVVVCFSIKTKDSSNNYYLAYNLCSPFSQNEKISEWKYEKQNTSNNIILPNNKETNEIWIELLKEIKEEGYAPVIIYQIDISTLQNVDSVGTH